MASLKYLYPINYPAPTQGDRQLTHLVETFSADTPELLDLAMNAAMLAAPTTLINDDQSIFINDIKYAVTNQGIVPPPDALVYTAQVWYTIIGT